MYFFHSAGRRILLPLKNRVETKIHAASRSWACLREIKDAHQWMKGFMIIKRVVVCNGFKSYMLVHTFFLLLFKITALQYRRRMRLIESVIMVGKTVIHLQHGPFFA
jgi:hypothetical protein